jgi:hypothetical protein
MHQDPTRTLSDSDVEAIALRLKEHFVNDFYKDIGKGVWSSVRKAIIWVVLAVAVYFAAKGQSLKP